jgi:hypothetical protein
MGQKENAATLSVRGAFGGGIFSCKRWESNPIIAAR